MSSIQETLKALHGCSDLLMEAYAGDRTFPDAAPTNWQVLTNLRLLHGNEVDGYRLSNTLRNLFDTIANAERRRLKTQNIEEWLTEIRHLIGSYRTANSRGSLEDASHWFQMVRDMVYELVDNLTLDCALLDFKVESQYGYVSTLEEKARENRFFHDRTGRLLDALTALSERELKALSDLDLDLRKLFLEELLPALQRCLEVLGDLLPRMRSLLWRFRVTDDQTRLVRGFAEHYRKNGCLDVPALEESTLNQSPLNFVAPLVLKAHPDPVTATSRGELSDIAEKLRPPQSFTDVIIEEEDTAGLVIEFSETETIELAVDPLEPIAAEYLIKALQDETVGLSASAFWEHTSTDDIPERIWLLWLFNQLNKSLLGDELMQLINWTPVELEEGLSGNKVISDLIVRRHSIDTPGERV